MKKLVDITNIHLYHGSILFTTKTGHIAVQTFICPDTGYELRVIDRDGMQLFGNTYGTIVNNHVSKNGIPSNRINKVLLAVYNLNKSHS